MKISKNRSYREMRHFYENLLSQNKKNGKIRYNNDEVSTFNSSVNFIMSSNFLSDNENKDKKSIIKKSTINSFKSPMLAIKGNLDLNKKKEKKNFEKQKIKKDNLGC